MIRGLSHLTLSVGDLDRALAFYSDTLGLRVCARWARGAYLSVGDLWLCLALDAATRTAPLDEDTHIALSVHADDFDPLAGRIVASGARIWKNDRSEGASIYFLDPDGHKLEVHVGDLHSRLASCRAQPYDQMVLYHLPAAGPRKALLVVDVLAGVFGLPAPLHRPGAFVENVRGLLDRARASAAPVVFARHQGPPGSPFATRSSGREFVDGIAPRAGEYVVDKQHPDAFQGSTLTRVLRELGIGTVCVCGFASEGCVDSTVRSAYALGFSVELASDAHTTTDNEVLDAARIVAHENHVLSRFASVKPCAKVVFS